MEINWASLIGIAFAALAVWRAFRVRRDLAASETRWERALFGNRPPVQRATQPVRFWCAIAVNTVIVLLLTLVAAAAFRALSFSALRMR